MSTLIPVGGRGRTWARVRGTRCDSPPIHGSTVGRRISVVIHALTCRWQHEQLGHFGEGLSSFLHEWGSDKGKAIRNWKPQIDSKPPPLLNCSHYVIDESRYTDPTRWYAALCWDLRKILQGCWYYSGWRTPYSGWRISTADSGSVQRVTSYTMEVRWLIKLWRCRTVFWPARR